MRRAPRGHLSETASTTVTDGNSITRSSDVRGAFVLLEPTRPLRHTLGKESGTESEQARGFP